MIDAFVLAGGRSQRMGFDKARLPGTQGWPRACEVAAALEAVAGRVCIVRRRGQDAGFWPRVNGAGEHAVVWEDDDAPRHALMGLATACLHATTPFVLVAPCDLVDLTAEAVQRLVQAQPLPALDGPATPLGDATGAVISQQPLLALLPRAFGPIARRAAEDGRSVREALAAATRVELPTAALRNANEPEDAPRRAMGWLASPVAWEAEVERRAARGLLAALPGDVGSG